MGECNGGGTGTWAGIDMNLETGLGSLLVRVKGSGVGVLVGVEVGSGGGCGGKGMRWG